MRGGKVVQLVPDGGLREMGFQRSRNHGGRYGMMVVRKKEAWSWEMLEAEKIREKNARNNQK